MGENLSSLVNKGFLKDDKLPQIFFLKKKNKIKAKGERLSIREIDN
jgi:hypothetical protein